MTDPITTTTNPSLAGGTSATRTPQSKLGKDDFLKMLAGQLQNQDPMSQSGSGEDMVAQMTQFSILEQLTNLADAQGRAADQQATSQALSLIGRTVTWTGADGAAQTGTVEKVGFDQGRPVLTVSGHEGVTPAEVSEVS
jgi:flagellar basal-body rod modification protein FlgD